MTERHSAWCRRNIQNETAKRRGVVSASPLCFVSQNIGRSRVTAGGCYPLESHALSAEISYSFDDLLRDKETVWDGIKNPQALTTLRNMRKGEHCVIYHSNTGKEAVGTATVVSVDASDPKNPAVKLKAGKRLKQPKSLADMRSAPVFEGSLLFRQFRLSVVPLTEEQYDWLLA